MTEVLSPPVGKDGSATRPMKLTVVEEATMAFYACLVANGGRLVPLTADDLAKTPNRQGTTNAGTANHSDY